MILASCKKGTENKTELNKSDFNLKTDYVNFKYKMSELDTIKIFIEHSICTSNAQERIEITKKVDSLKIKSEYFEATFNKNPKWELVYEKTISENDTVWDFGKFLLRNKKRMSSEKRKSGKIQIKHKNDTIQLFTNGLLDSFAFFEDFTFTTEKIYPEYINKIRPVFKRTEMLKEEDVKETKLEVE